MQRLILALPNIQNENKQTNIRKYYRISFPRVLLDFINHNSLTINTGGNSSLFNYQSWCPNRYEINVINNVTKDAKLISSSKIIL